MKWDARTAKVAIGGALVVLLVVAAILVRGLLPANSVAEKPSPTATASSSTSESPAPSEAATPTGAEPTPSYAPAANTNGPILAISLVNNLRIRDEPGAGGAIVSTMQSGDVAFVLDGQAEADGMNWRNVQAAGGVVGWVAEGPAADPYLDLRRQLVENLPAHLDGLAAGDSGFLAWGEAARRSDDVARPVVVASEDGITWRRAAMPEPALGELAAGNALVAWGPAGWLLAITNPEAPTASFWQSPDGISWTSLAGPEYLRPNALVGGPAGYLMDANSLVPCAVDQTESLCDGPARRLLSPDGQSWQEADVPDNGEATLGDVSVGSTFLEWRATSDRTTIFASPNGRVWRQVGGNLPNSANDAPLIATVGGQIVTVLTDYATGDQTVWRGSLPLASLSWERQSGAESTLAGVAITNIASDGSVLILLGHDWADATPRLFSSTDGRTFTAISIAEAFAGAGPSRLVGGARGFAAVGSRYTAADENPVLWSAPDGIDWRTESQPVLGIVDSPIVGACPPLPASMVDWLLVPTSTAVACFGTAEITFTAWRTDAEGCGGFFPGSFEPDWLARPYAGIPLVLTPFETPYGGCGSAVPRPTLTSLPPTQHWIRITGHYDDPAAETCRWIPERPYAGVYVSPGYFPWTCRSKFVATAATAAAAP